MSIKISYKKGISEKLIKNYVLFANEEFKVNGLSKLSLSKQSNQINKTIISNRSKTKDFVSFNLNPGQKIILIKLKNNQSALENEKKGAVFYNFIKSNSILSLTLLEKNIKETQSKNKNFLDEFLHGTQLKSYEFNKYKKKKKKRDSRNKYFY